MIQYQKISKKNSTGIRRCITADALIGEDEFMFLPSGYFLISHLRDLSMEPIFAEQLADEFCERLGQWESIQLMMPCDGAMGFEMYGRAH